MVNTAAVQTTAKSVAGFIRKYSPKILTGLGITGVFSTAIATGFSTVKAVDICQEEDAETFKERFILSWKYYIPPAVMGFASAACIFGANTISSKREAALLSLYTIADSTLQEYRHKIVESLGDKKADELATEVNKKYFEQTPPTSEVIIAGKHDTTLFYDTISGRYFKSDVQTVMRIQNELNKKTLEEMWASLNDYYYALGLEQSTIGDNMGWTSARMIDIHFASMLTPDLEPAIVLDHMNLPIPLWK